jgi:hypothetical protein
LRWRSLALTHVDLIERLAVDGAEGLAAPGRGLQPGDIERLRYPLERASAFAVSSRGRFGGAQWVDDFDALLAAYGELVDHLDRARTAAVGPAEAERARALAERVSAAATAVRGELLLSLLPVREKPLETDVGQRVLAQLLDDLERTRRHVCAHARRGDEMDGVAHARDQDLAVVVVVGENLDELADQGPSRRPTKGLT